MSLDLLGEGFDLHCGGMDLRFPHHENERAQAVALGERFANHWMHNGFVVDAEGEKMSKSIGNVSNLLDLLEQYDGRTYRMLLLQSHYRSPVRIGVDNLQAAEKSLAGLDAFAARTAGADGEPDAAVLDAFRAAMDDDLDTPGGDGRAVRHGAAGQRRPRRGGCRRRRPGRRGARDRRRRRAVIGRTDEVPADVQERAAAIDAARAAKDYATGRRHPRRAAGRRLDRRDDADRDDRPPVTRVADRVG